MTACFAGVATVGSCAAFAAAAAAVGAACGADVGDDGVAAAVASVVGNDVVGCLADRAVRLTTIGPANCPLRCST